MKTVNWVLAVVALGAIPTAWGGGVAPPTEGLNRFALELYAEAAEGQGNFFYSPLSVSLATSMLYAGARTETEAQMARVLHTDSDQKSYHQGMAQLRGAINESMRASRVQLNVANALFAQSGFDVRAAYRRTVEGQYGAGLFPVDFATAHQTSRQRVNRWVANKTRGRIGAMIPEGMLTADTRLVVLNAVYFKAQWLDPFDRSETRWEPFWVAKDKPLKVPMMHGSGYYRYGESEELQILQLFYKGARMSMTIVLPRVRDGLSALEAQLSPEVLADWMALQSGESVRVALPRFTMESEVNLIPPLLRLGMTDLFSEQRANLFGITEMKPFFVSNFLHKAGVIVTEEGTEAYAASAADAGFGGPPPEPQWRTFRADHPFLFIIRDIRTGVILFMGRVVDPTA